MAGRLPLDRPPRRAYDCAMLNTAFRCGLGIALTVLICASASAAPAKPPTIVLVSGEFEYKSAETLPVLRKQLEAKLGAKCVYLARPADPKAQTIAGLEALDTADLAIIFIRRMTLPEEQLAHFKKFAASGKPSIGLRTASHAFENWKEWDRDVLGGNYQNHHNNKLATTVRVVPEAAGHPILKGVAKEFASPGSLYRNSPLPSGSKVLLMGSVEGKPAEPVAWTHDYQGTPVFYTSLGHPEEFGTEAFDRLLLNAVQWALAQPVRKTEAAGAAEPVGFRRVGVADFDKLWREKRYTVLDVRTADEFKDGHIPGAVNLDVLDDSFEKKVAALDKSKTYLVHCAAGRRSATAAAEMKKLGFKSVVDLAPGFNGWKAAGKPVEK
ncbi:MAG: heme-binding domain-containing protein [Limisphaerales bacterium]|nr:MAG: heme-binding domain-containing protein [Limisphaerales bacterium]KAG0508968.1 MAG: heme-binding domain-containing protein [Limisphaerales bacterium]TXT51311.1 MAG: heme-binding domain-containing protein [Limisphaerales bacterium]